MLMHPSQQLLVICYTYYHMPMYVVCRVNKSTITMSVVAAAAAAAAVRNQERRRQRRPRNQQ